MNDAVCIARPLPTVLRFERSDASDKDCDLSQEDYYCESGCDRYFLFSTPCACGIPHHLIEALTRQAERDAERAELLDAEMAALRDLSVE